jgi:hypothetical protein
MCKKRGSEMKEKQAGSGDQISQSRIDEEFGEYAAIVWHVLRINGWKIIKQAAEPSPTRTAEPLLDFNDGVEWAAQCVETGFDQPTIAAEIRRLKRTENSRAESLPPPEVEK